MGNWSKIQEERKEYKEKDKTRRECLAKYLYDLSKITFTGLVIGGIASLYSDTPMNSYYRIYVILAGILLAYMFAWLGNRILKQ